MRSLEDKMGQEVESIQRRDFQDQSFPQGRLNVTKECQHTMRPGQHCKATEHVNLGILKVCSWNSSKEKPWRESRVTSVVKAVTISFRFLHEPSGMRSRFIVYAGHLACAGGRRDLEHSFSMSDYMQTINEGLHG